MPKQLAVLGAGAIGGSIGADLTIAGHNVLLIDQWPAHVEAMKAHGLYVTMPEEELHTPVTALHLCELAGVRPQLDIVFLAAKSYDSCWMAELIKPYLQSDGVVVSVQNSFNDEWIAPIIGYHRDIACVVELSAEVFEPGHVKRNTGHARTSFVLGELHGRITPRLKEIAEILSAAGTAETSTNIWGAKWSKIVFQTMMFLDVIAGVALPEIIQNPKLLGLAVRIGSETMQVGVSLGYTLEPIFGLTAEDLVSSPAEMLEKILRGMFSLVRKGVRSQRVQDIQKGRRTELDYLNGLVVKKGKEAGVPTPMNEAVISLVKQIEQGKLKAGMDNLETLLGPDRRKR